MPLDSCCQVSYHYEETPPWAGYVTHAGSSQNKLMPGSSCTLATPIPSLHQFASLPIHRYLLVPLYGFLHLLPLH